MPALEVPGAILDYATTGTGPPIILIPGAPGNSTVYRLLVPPLSRHFTVTTYSRRGYSNSLLRGAQDYSQRLATDADDLAALLAHITTTSPTSPKTRIFGTSSGAIVALSFIQRHPSLAHPSTTLTIAHEPPATTALADPHHRAEIQHHLASLYPLYRAAGAPHALEAFAAIFPDARDRATMALLMDPAESADMRADVTYWFEREMDYVRAEWDWEGLRGVRGGLVLAVGERSRGDRVVGAPVVAVWERVFGGEGEGLVVVPGGHLGYLSEAEAFAEALAKV